MNDKAPMTTPKTEVDTETNRTGFRADLETLINKHSKENGSDTPDFILADYMADCLEAYDKAATRRTEWYKTEPKESRISGKSKRLR